MDSKEFNKLDITHRFTLVYNTGEFISAINFTDFKVSLYLVANHFVEVYFNAKSDTIDAIKTLEGTEPRLSLYTSGVNIQDLYR